MYVTSGGQEATQQTRDIEPMLGYCWSSVEDHSPTLTQHGKRWLNVVGCMNTDAKLSTITSSVQYFILDLQTGIPRKNEASSLCWFNNGKPSAALAHY